MKYKAKFDTTGDLTWLKEDMILLAPPKNWKSIDTFTRLKCI